MSCLCLVLSSEDVRENGFSVIVDARNSNWQNTKLILRTLQVSCGMPGSIIHAHFVTVSWTMTLFTSHEISNWTLLIWTQCFEWGYNVTAIERVNVKSSYNTWPGSHTGSTILSSLWSLSPCLSLLPSIPACPTSYLLFPSRFPSPFSFPVHLLVLYYPSFIYPPPFVFMPQIHSITSSLQEALPAQIHVVYIIQPGQFWQKQQSSRGHSKEKGKLEFSVSFTLKLAIYTCSFTNIQM